MAISLNTAIESIDVNKLTSAIMSLVDTFINFFDTLFNTIDWNKVWDLLKSTLSSQNFDWMKIIETIGIATLQALIVSTLTTGLSSLGSVIASAAANIASNPIVLTATAAAFGISGAAFGLKQVVKATPKVIESTKEVVSGDENSLKALKDLGSEFDVLGGNF